MPILIKRYQNRKLYNTQTKRYITLEEIEDLIKKEEDVIVIDNNSGKDITAITLSQIIFEFEKNRKGILPIKLLLSLIQSGGNRIDEIKRNILDPLKIYLNYDIEIERRINLLIESDELDRELGTQILNKLISIGNQEDNSNDEIEQALSSYMIEHHVPTRTDLQLLIQKIDLISEQVEELNIKERSENKKTKEVKS